MKVLLSIIFFIALTVALTSRSSLPVAKMRLRTLLLSFLLSSVIYVQLFYFIKPVKVDYWTTGWLGMIHYINARFAANSWPYRLPEP